MKLNELISSFEIYTTNDEQQVLESMQSISPIDQFTEREQVIIDNLVKKSLISKCIYNGQTMVVKNEY
jgi:hypothetical protein